MRRLTVFLFHPTIEWKGRVMLKPHHGKFLDSIAPGFSTVTLVAPYLREDAFPAWMLENGKPLYDYTPQAKNLRVVRGFSHRLLYPLRFCQNLLHLLSADDVLFFCPSVSAAVLAPFCRFFGKRHFAYVAIDIESHYRERFRNRILGTVLARLNEFAIRTSRGVLARGEGAAQRYSRSTSVVHVSPLLNLEPHLVSDEQALARPERRRGLFVGPIVPRKRVEVLIEAVHFLRQQGIRWEVEIVGNQNPEFPGYYEELRQRVQTLGLSQLVHFSGYLRDDELRAAYLRSGTLILPSSSEGFPKVVNEAMMLGAVPILTPLEGYKGLLEEGRHCFYLSEPWAQSLAQSIASAEDRQLDQMRLENLKLIAKILEESPDQQFLKLCRS